MIMKILVPVKRVVDYNVKIKVKSDNSGVDLENVKMSMNPFDEIAVEEAVRLKEKKLCNEITVISIGSIKSEETLRTALAIGADKAIRINQNPKNSRIVAECISNYCGGCFADFYNLDGDLVNCDNDDCDPDLAWKY